MRTLLQWMLLYKLPPYPVMRVITRRSGCSVKAMLSANALLKRCLPDHHAAP